LSIVISQSNNIITNPNKDIETPITNISNLCQGGKHCPNYIIICQLEKQIKMLNDTITQLKQINEFGDIKQNKLSLSEFIFDKLINLANNTFNS